MTATPYNLAKPNLWGSTSLLMNSMFDPTRNTYKTRPLKQQRVLKTSSVSNSATCSCARGKCQVESKRLAYSSLVMLPLLHNVLPQRLHKISNIAHKSKHRKDPDGSSAPRHVSGYTAPLEAAHLWSTFKDGSLIVIWIRRYVRIAGLPIKFHLQKIYLSDILSTHKWRYNFKSWPGKDLLQTIQDHMHYVFVLSTENGWLAFLGPNKRDSVKGEETWKYASQLCLLALNLHESI